MKPPPAPCKKGGVATKDTMPQTQQKKYYRGPKKRSNQSQSSKKRNRRSNQSQNASKAPKKTGIIFKETTATLLKKAELEQASKSKSKSKPTNRSRNNKNKASRNKGRLSDHFAKTDFYCDHCIKSKIEKRPFRISLGLIGALEKLRTKIEKRIEIIKGYECIESTELRKSFKKNYHTMGLAAIIECKDIDLETLLHEAAQIEELKYIIANYDDNTLYIDSRKEDIQEIWQIRKKEKKAVVLETKSEISAKITAPSDSSEKNG